MAGSDRGACRLVCREKEVAEKTSFEKEKQLVVTDASGEIIWLLGERPDNRYKITDDTEKVLKIILHNY